MILLAEFIDRLVDGSEAFIAETEMAATVSGLSAANSAALIALCNDSGWAISVFDSAGSEWLLDEKPDQDFAPFRISIQKPAPPEDTLQLISNHSLARWLQQGHDASQWHIARLSTSLCTQTRSFQPWGSAPIPVYAPTAKSPRRLVREFGGARKVPDDIRPWLAQPLDEDQWAIAAVQVWAREAAYSMVYCLPDEIDSDDSSLKFQGPPRMTLRAMTEDDPPLDLVTFNDLQVALKWVFDNERETEMRHILLATELARSSTAPRDVAAFLKDHLVDAWQCAQIAYKMTLANTCRDTLKTLGDLRKTVTDETAKLSDLSRHLAAAIAGALATGLGLIAARVATNAPVGFILAIMVVIGIYVLQVILSGSQFIRLQRTLRKEWHSKLYRFLPSNEYTKMVTNPVRRAECSFYWTAILGGASVLILLIVCLWTILYPTKKTISNEGHPSSSVTVKNINQTIQQQDRGQHQTAKDRSNN